MGIARRAYATPTRTSRASQPSRAFVSPPPNREAALTWPPPLSPWGFERFPPLHGRQLKSRKPPVSSGPSTRVGPRRPPIPNRVEQDPSTSSCPAWTRRSPGRSSTPPTRSAPTPGPPRATSTSNSTWSDRWNTTLVAAGRKKRHHGRFLQARKLAQCFRSPGPVECGDDVVPQAVVPPSALRHASAGTSSMPWNPQPFGVPASAAP